MINKILLFVFVFACNCNNDIYKIPTPDKVLLTVVAVNNSSGILVYSDGSYSLVLTSLHTISDLQIDENINFSSVKFIWTYIPEGSDEQEVEVFSFPIEVIYKDDVLDLALLKIESGVKYYYATVSKDKLVLGQEIYAASNPKGNYRSLKRGIVSSTDRWAKKSSVWEMDCGVIFGSSGGGVFNMKGELVGIIRAMDSLQTNFCSDMYDDDGNIVGSNCLSIPMTFIGYFSPPDTIKKFLLDSKVEVFDYLKKAE